ncbi:putative aarF domain-containing protein kinase [Chlorella vulgaris]
MATLAGAQAGQALRSAPSPRCRHSRAPVVRVACRAAGSAPPYTGSSSGASSSSSGGVFGAASPQVDAAARGKRLQDLQALLREAAEIAIATGPRSITRSAQAVSALLSVARDQAVRFQAGQSPEAPAVVLRKLFERLGATYIKLGQFIASSPTLFPEEYVLEFQKCLDSTEPVSFDVIRPIIESELRLSLDDVFVHAAVLRGSNKEVVIKVLKPGVQDVLTADLNFLYLSSKFLEFISPDLSRTSLSAVVGDIRASMLDEVDFTKEAAHLAQFDAYLDRAGLRGVATCPGIYRQFSSQRVMVMDRLRGVPLTDLAAVRSVTSVDPEAVLINALNTWFGSVVGCETFHADVHAGNLLVLPDGRVGFIDFGIVGSISPVTWRAIEALLLATGAGDYDTMARALVTIGATMGEVDIKAFAADLEKLFTSLRDIDTELLVQAGSGGVSASVAADDAAINRFLLDLVRVGESNGIRFPREFALLIKQLLYFDRYNRILAPQLRVYDDQRINLRKVDLDYDLQ